MTQLSGVHAAAVTLRGKHGDLDCGAMFELVDLLSRSGLAGIAFFDTAGEYPAFSRDERRRLVHLAAKRSRVPLLAGIGSSTLDESVELARAARDSGAEALLLPPPFFFPLTQEEIRDFYVSFAAQVGDPSDVFLRHPAGAGVNGITPDTARLLIASAGFAGIADAGAECLDLAGECAFLAGDSSWVRARSRGAMGAILELACAVPELAVALDRALANGSQSETIRLEALFMEFSARVRSLPPLAAIHAALRVRGIGAAPADPSPRLSGFLEWFREWMKQFEKISAHA